MTISEAYNEALTAIHQVSVRYWNETITLADAKAQHAAILEVYDQRVQRIQSAELAKHTHDFAIP